MGNETEKRIFILDEDMAYDYLLPATSPMCLHLYMTYIEGIVPVWNAVIMQKKLAVVRRKYTLPLAELR